ncbi:MAG: cation:proton antiporter [Firmicutes bacterium]|nr:cation:proton antiporter [Bacillota bacterium]
MSDLLQILLVLSIAVAASKAAGAVSNRFGQPAVLGELSAGLILGPTLLNILGMPVFHTEKLLELFKELGELGVIFLMFLAGLETNLREMRKVGLAALLGAVGGVLLPFAGGMLVGNAFGFSTMDAIFIGTVLTATSVSITAQTLIELGRLRSKEGTTILGAAIIDDVLGILVLSFVVAFGTGGGEANLTGIAVIVGKMALFFGAGILLGNLVFDRLAARIERSPISEGVLAFAVVVLLIYSWAAEFLGGVAAITGAYLAGVLFGRSRFHRFLDERMKILAYGFFVPVFFISIGLQANARDLGGSIPFVVVVSMVAVFSKLVGAGAGCRLAGFSNRESVRVGTGMISRGEVALIVAAVGLSAGIIGPEVFSAMVIMTLFTTLVTPILLRQVFKDRAIKNPA